MAKKAIKIRAKITRDSGGTHYSYPPEYNKDKIQVVAYESVGDLVSVKGRGDKDEYVIGVIDENDLAQFIASPDIEEITIEEARQLVNRFVPPTITIADPKAVIDVVAKMRAGEPLRLKEMGVIDPDSPELGINRIGRNIDDFL